MSLIVYERHKYVSAYRTNLSYLQNMTKLQVKLLKGMEWIENFINTADLWAVSDTWLSNEHIKGIVNNFIDDLNKELMGL